MNRNTFTLLAAVAALALALGFAGGATFNGGCAKIADAPFGCAEYLLARYQTLIAMFGAVFIGIYAVQPVLKQLRLMSLQTTVTLHQTYSAREKILDGRARSELKELEKLESDLTYGSHYLDDPGATHWVWEMGQEIDRIVVRLQKRQAENLDGDETTLSRQQLIAELKLLSDCMSDYNGTVYLDDPEYEVSDEDRMKVEAAEVQAAKDLPARIESGTEAISNLERAFDADLAEIRLKRQLIDQVLVNADPP